MRVRVCLCMCLSLRVALIQWPDSSSWGSAHIPVITAVPSADWLLSAPLRRCQPVSHTVDSKADSTHSSAADRTVRPLMSYEVRFINTVLLHEVIDPPVESGFPAVSARCSEAVHKKSIHLVPWLKPNATTRVNQKKNALDVPPIVIYLLLL